MLRKILSLTFLLFLVSLSAHAQYSTSYSQGVTDATSYATSGHNLWFSIGATCQQGSLLAPPSGIVYCKGMDNYEYGYDKATKTWIQQTAFGNQMNQIVMNATDTYALGPGGLDWAACQAAGEWSILHWNGSAWVGLHGCLSQMTLATDGTLGGVNAYTIAYISTDGGQTWIRVGTGTNWSYVNVTDSGDACGVQGGVLNLIVNGTPTPVTPSPGTVQACDYQPSAPTTQFFLIHDSLGHVKMLNFSTGAWQDVGGTNMKTLAGVLYSGIFGLDLSGTVYHFNVYPQFTGGNTTGSFNGCPTAPCVNGVTHTITLGFQAYSGAPLLDSVGGQTTISPITNANVIAYAINDPVSCDLFFGDPSDPACHVPNVTGEAHCNASNTTLATPPPTQPSHFSEYVEAYDGHYTLESQVNVPPVGGWPGGYEATVNCSATVNGCHAMTIPVCGPAQGVSQTVHEHGFQLGNAASPAGALGNAVQACKNHSALYNGAWGRLSSWTYVNSKLTCTPVTFYDEHWAAPCY